MNIVDILKSLVKKERACQVEFLKALLQVEAKKTYLELSYSSLFAFVTGELKLSEGTASKRIQVAHCGAKSSATSDGSQDAAAEEIYMRSSRRARCAILAMEESCWAHW